MSTTVKLNDGNEMPILGFGTWDVRDSEHGEKIIAEAIKSGYRHFDSASLYGSEKSVGIGIRDSGIPRNQFYVTTKVWRNDMTAKAARKSLHQSLDNLMMDYVDLLLIHWPTKRRGDPRWKDTLVEVWGEFEHMQKEGLVRSIGVSNFFEKHFNAMGGSVVPAVNQIEFHPGYLQSDVVDYCKAHGITVQAWGPLGQARLIDHEVVESVAKKHKATTAQVLLNFCVSQGIVALVKSADKRRMRENTNIFDVNLDSADYAILRSLPDRTAWSGEHPDYL